MKREELMLKYAEISAEMYDKLLNKVASNSPTVSFSEGKVFIAFKDENALPMNGIYVMTDKLSSPKRIVRIGTHEPSNANGLLSRVFNHLVGSKNRSILRKHIGSSLLVGNGKKLNKWLLKSEKGDAQTEAAITDYIEKHLEVAFLPVGDLKSLAELEKYLISAVAQATVTKTELVAARADWLGNSCDDKTVAEYGIWNDDHVKWHPKDEAELKRFTRTLDKWLQ